MTVPDASFTRFYPGGWHNQEEPNLTSPITKDPLNGYDTALAAVVARANASMLLNTVNALAADGPLTIAQHNVVDAFYGNRTMTLANATKAGQIVTVEKLDTSTNTVTVTGTFRGSAGSIVLSLTKEALCLVSAADFSWYPFAGHKTLSSMDARYTSSAVVTAAHPSIVLDRPSGVVEGLFLAAYGESDLAQTGNSASTYFDRVKNRIGGLFGNYGVGGSLVADICANAFGTVAGIRQGAAANGLSAVSGACTWVPAPYIGTVGGIVILEPLRNDAGLDGTSTFSGTTAKSRAGATNGLDALIRLFRAGVKIENNATRSDAACATTSGSPTVTDAACVLTDFGNPVTGPNVPANSYVGTVTAGVSFLLSSTSGSQTNVNATGTASGQTFVIGRITRTGAGWATTTNTGCSGNSISYTTTNGNTATYKINLTATAKVAWITLAVDAAALGVTGATYSVSVDGGTAVTGTTNDQTRRTGKLSLGFGQMAVDLGSLAAGVHNIVITNTSSTGPTLYDDCLLIESATPPTIIIDKVRYLTALGYSTAYPGITASTTVDDIYNGIVDTVVARFPADGSVVVIDPNAAGWDPTTMVGNSDGFHIHKNDKGERFYADMYMAVINQLVPREGLVKIA